MDPVVAVEAVEKILNYSFVNKTLLKAALPQTFPEGGKGRAESFILYKRLEFLGDSVLEVAFTYYIYHAYPNLKLSALNLLRLANVSNEKFARAAVKHNLYRYAINEKKRSPGGAKFLEAVSKEGDHVPYGELVKAPKIFANLVESIAGAVYIDVNYDVQRFWEILRGLLEPIYTPDDLRLQLKPSSLALFRLADEHGKRIDFRYSKDVYSNKNIAEVYLDDIFIASGRAKSIHTAKLLAAAGVLQTLSDCLPIGKNIDEDSLHVEPEDVKGKSIEICSKEKLHIQTGSYSLPTASENSLTDEMAQEKMVIDDDCIDMELEDVKRKSIEICSTEKLQTQTGSSSFTTASKNPLTEEMTEERIVFDEDSPHVEPEHVKGKSFEICSTENLQLQTELPSFPSTFENPLTDEMKQEQMVIDEDSPHVEPDDAETKLFEICAKNKWPRPIFSVEEERGQKNEQKFVCSVKIEIPTIEGSFHMKGDVKPKKKQAENSSANHMIRALKSSIMSLVISNLQMPKSLDEKKKNLQMQESLDENKYLHSKKRRTTYEITPNKMVTGEDSLDVEPEDVKGKSIEICSTEKLQTQTGSSSFPTASKNPLSDEMTEEKIVIDEDSPHVEREDVKGKSSEICSTEKLRLQTESSSLSAPSENPLTNEMKQEQMVTDKDSSHVEPDSAKGKLFEICAKKKWPWPIFSVEEEREPKNEQKIVCSVKIEIPTIEGTFFIKGDAKSMKKQAENSSAYHMIRAINNLQMVEKFEKKENFEKKESSLFGSKKHSRSVKAVEKILNYIFTNKDLLNKALSRASSLFERLMFVGSAALELAFTTHIYLMYPKFEAWEMDLLRRENTRNKTYARVTGKHNIYQFFMRKVKLDEKIKLSSEVESKENGPVPQSAKLPKVVSDFVDSVAGAVFIDMNFDVKRLWEIFRGLFEPLYTLDDWRLRPQPLRTLFCLGDKHGKRFDFSQTRDAAKKSAAMEALRKLSKSMPVEIVMDEEDILDTETEHAKGKLIKICKKRKWPNPVYSVETYEHPGGFVCSATIETPTEEGTLYAKGDRRRRRRTAENSSATQMLRALEFSLKDDL